MIRTHILDRSHIFEGPTEFGTDVDDASSFDLGLVDLFRHVLGDEALDFGVDLTDGTDEFATQVVRRDADYHVFRPWRSDVDPQLQRLGGTNGQR